MTNISSAYVWMLMPFLRAVLQITLHWEHKWSQNPSPWVTTRQLHNLGNTTISLICLNSIAQVCYYTKIWPGENCEELLINQAPPATLLCFPCSSSWPSFDPVTDEEIHRIIAKSLIKCCNLDPMPKWMVKGATAEIVVSIEDIVNDSMSTGRVPKSVRNGPHVLCSRSFWPVSDLPFLSRVLVKTVACRLIRYKNTHSLHDLLQPAYNAGYSTETAFTKVQNDPLMSMNKQWVAILFLLEMTLVFHIIDKTSSG